MLKSHFSPHHIEAGCDEAGRGCLAGPVVAAAVILPKKYRHKKLNDSKQLTANEREKLKLEIQSDAIAWSVGEASNEEIDQINILNASFLAMHRAIAGLGVKAELLLIDGNRFKPYPGIDHRCIIKGDARYLSIAAASVLAKTHRDEFMCSLAEKWRGYAWEKNMGYPTQDHRKGIRELGVTPYHRKSFQLLPAQLDLFKPE